MKYFGRKRDDAKLTAGPEFPVWNAVQQATPKNLTPSQMMAMNNAISNAIKKADVKGTTWYLHDPNMPQSVRIGKTAHSAGAVTWYTYPSREWADTGELLGYLNRLCDEGRVKSGSKEFFISWICSEYGEICLPGQMATRIVDCSRHVTHHVT